MKTPTSPKWDVASLPHFFVKPNRTTLLASKGAAKSALYSFSSTALLTSLERCDRNVAVVIASSCSYNVVVVGEAVRTTCSATSLKIKLLLFVLQTQSCSALLFSWNVWKPHKVLVWSPWPAWRWGQGADQWLVIQSSTLESCDLSRLQSPLLHVALTGKGGDVKPWRHFCSGAISDLVLKSVVVLVHVVKSSPVDLNLCFMFTVFPFP